MENSGFDQEEQDVDSLEKDRQRSACLEELDSRFRELEREEEMRAEEDRTEYKRIQGTLEETRGSERALTALYEDRLELLRCAERRREGFIQDMREKKERQKEKITGNGQTNEIQDCY